MTYQPLTGHAADYRGFGEQFEREVVNEIKAEHQRAPKYVYAERSADEIVRQNSVEVIPLSATLRQRRKKWENNSRR